MRLRHQNQDLTGRTLTSSAPDQHLVSGCTFDGTRFVGDWRGTDFLGNTGPADWSQAQTYGCYWRGHKKLAGSLWPADIGDFHHQPVGTIIGDGVESAPPEFRRRLRALGNQVFSADPAASWDTSGKEFLWGGLKARDRERMADAFRAILAPYYKLAARFEELVLALQGSRDLWTPADPQKLLTRTLTWRDGATITLDADALPALTEPSRYALSRWAEEQADTQRSGRHYAFIYSGRPLVAMTFTEPDGWLRGLGGY